MFEKFTERARKVMSLSRKEAQRLQAEFIGTEHILLGIIQEGGGVAAKVLKNLNVDLKRIRRGLEKLISPPSEPKVALGVLPFSPRAKRSIEEAGEAASAFGHNVIGTEHLLLGLLKEGRGIGAQVLVNLGLKIEEVRDMVLEVLGADVEASSRPAPAPPFWSHPKFEILVDRPALRHTVSQELLQKRNVALVGPRNAGKTSLVALLVRAGSARYEIAPVDYRFFDPTQEFELPHRSGRPTVWLLPEGQILTATGTSALERLMTRMTGGDRFLIEFTPATFHAFGNRFPVLSRELTPVRVDMPTTAEARLFLHSARTHVMERFPIRITDLVLDEANRMAVELIPHLPTPWSTIQALHEAAPIEKALQYPRKIWELSGEIAKLRGEKQTYVNRQEFERAARTRDAVMALQRQHDALIKDHERSLRDTPLSIEAIRTALERMAENG